MALRKNVEKTRADRRLDKEAREKIELLARCRRSVNRIRAAADSLSTLLETFLEVEHTIALTQCMKDVVSLLNPDEAEKLHDDVQRTSTELKAAMDTVTQINGSLSEPILSISGTADATLLDEFMSDITNYQSEQTMDSRQSVHVQSRRQDLQQQQQQQQQMFAAPASMSFPHT